MNLVKDEVLDEKRKSTAPEWKPAAHWKKKTKRRKTSAKKEILDFSSASKNSPDSCLEKRKVSGLNVIQKIGID